LINNYAYNNQIVRFLLNSIKLAALAFPLSIIYIVLANILFMGTLHKVISVLCFPTLMLAIDSFFLFLGSWRIQQHLVYFYNQNISDVSPIYKIELYEEIVSSATKCSHFLNLIIVCSGVIL
jgi:hypothetical protein